MRTTTELDKAMSDSPGLISATFHLSLMQNQSAPEIEMLRAAYAAFNTRDIDSALALMTLLF